ncbi:uncharacterized protein RAG0_06712 [Rhynchosporium agropyri]|uniref:Uncharacterized protein n=2 Tax=Rhynchosporium TaxID=38037 RepID=A0A1E1M6E0_RHYSE|nr:uncharacterized protein RAG0_06712 [Rhynchosporium agropyri]CZT44670.1 uncharacterized protein RSE6_04869 [Rhynchosporium secalis]
MQFTTAISALVAVAGLASAATPSYGIEMVPVPEGYFESHLGETGVTLSPAVAVQRRLSSRAITHVYVCINSNFSGACQNVQVNTGGCYNFVGNYNDAISSIGPDQGTTCTIWFDAGCSGRSVGGIINPGIYNLNDYNFNDVASSVRCN